MRKSKTVESQKLKRKRTNGGKKEKENLKKQSSITNKGKTCFEEKKNYKRTKVQKNKSTVVEQHRSTQV